MSGFWDILKSFFGSAEGPVHFEAASVSDKGLVRSDNQDSYLMRAQSFFLAVADGMGGGQGGALASAWICEEFARRLDAPGVTPFRLRVAQTNAALQDANARVREYAEANGYKSMGSTAAVLLADPERSRRAVVAHVGDSRVYRWRNGRGQLLTRDHTVGSEIGRALTNASQAQSLQSRSNPLTHILTRAVGIGFKVRAEWRKIDVRPGDRFLLCTDGVHDVLSDVQIASLIGRAKTPAQAVESVAEKVVAAGAPDNYTIVCAFTVKD